MTTSIAILILFIVTVIAANIPFLTDKVFLVQEAKGNKPFWLRFSEWFLLYIIVMAIAIGLETKLHGAAYAKVWEFWNFAENWEFYAITLCLFVVFALPGFIYQYDLKKHLK
ncbi:DUF2818 family protein [sulfur-oxidizing endosymbiont of Gigantopelta aegis]|uniref:DUF2818 family protein n=1 Tax=sulfur-oxidizing endosymbiont of Gigantopelta aegis TaxID=2794934 RepID=UPI0018DD4163|nr:DUF2818 family protein [sulfur-oxidizing endosymbiont of Gigantopelta aegis]